MEIPAVCSSILFLCCPLFWSRNHCFSQESENSTVFRERWELLQLTNYSGLLWVLFTTTISWWAADGEPPMISVSVSMTPPILLNRFSRIRTIEQGRTQQSAGIYLLEIGRQQSLHILSRILLCWLAIYVICNRFCYSTHSLYFFRDPILGTWKRNR